MSFIWEGKAVFVTLTRNSRVKQVTFGSGEVSLGNFLQRAGLGMEKRKVRGVGWAAPAKRGKLSRWRLA